MAHIEVNTFLKTILLDYLSNHPNPSVLEIGSYDVNGSVRACFETTSRYVGVDLIAGPSVDVVCKGHLYRATEKFDIVLSVESFEHNSDWVETFSNMLKHVKDDGLIIFTCATTGRLEHGTYRTDPFSSPGTATDVAGYYRNLSESDFRERFNFGESFSVHGFFVNAVTRDLYFYGYKGSDLRIIKLLGNSFTRATEIAGSIRKNKSYVNYLIVKSFYLLLSPLFLVLSDEKYQNLVFRPYRFIRQTLGRGSDR